MAALQKQVAGGQILTTTVGDDWLTDAGLAHAVAETLRAVAARGDGFFVARSIRLGGHEVLAGTEQGVQALLATAFVRQRGWRDRESTGCGRVGLNGLSPDVGDAQPPGESRSSPVPTRT